jgi:RNA polymerase sigma factor (sigma-70 family)
MEPDLNAAPVPYFQVIAECEAAIVRIRAALRVGATDAEAVGADWELIRRHVMPRLIGFARGAAWLGPEAVEEALDAMVDRMLDDIWSLSFVSLETQFGAYLRSMAARVLYNMRRRYLTPGTATPLQRLDAARDERSPHELVETAAVRDWFGQVAERDELETAIKLLPPDERYVIALRRQDLGNNEVARRLGVSAATATRIYQRAVKSLRRQLVSGRYD